MIQKPWDIQQTCSVHIDHEPINRSTPRSEPQKKKTRKEMRERESTCLGSPGRRRKRYPGEGCPCPRGFHRNPWQLHCFAALKIKEAKQKTRTYSRWMNKSDGCSCRDMGCCSYVECVYARRNSEWVGGWVGEDEKQQADLGRNERAHGVRLKTSVGWF